MYMSTKWISIKTESISSIMDMLTNHNILSMNLLPFNLVLFYSITPILS